MCVIHLRGYLAPEYAIRGQLTRKADVYSLGMLLLEIVCGRRNRDSRLPPKEKFLLELVWNFWLSSLFNFIG